jgi:hypothetical protein
VAGEGRQARARRRLAGLAGAIWALGLIGGPLLHAIDHQDDHVHGPGGAIVRIGPPAARHAEPWAPEPASDHMPAHVARAPVVMSIEPAPGARAAPADAPAADEATRPRISAPRRPDSPRADVGGHLHGLALVRGHRLGADPARRPEARALAVRPPPEPFVARARRTTRARAPPRLAPS